MFGVTANVVKNYENDFTEPSKDKIVAVSLAWDIPQSWFYDGRDSAVPNTPSFVREVSPPYLPSTVGSGKIPHWGKVPAGDFRIKLTLELTSPSTVALSGILPGDVALYYDRGGPKIRTPAHAALVLSGEDANGGLWLLSKLGSGPEIVHYLDYKPYSCPWVEFWSDTK